MRLLATLVVTVTVAPVAHGQVVYEGKEGPGKGKHVVLIAGDEEYRSEEALPQLGKILAKHHGFKCTVLLPVDPKDGTVNPNASNIPGLEALKTADLAVIFLRFRNLPDEQMKLLVDYIESGKPIVGMRTATHAFNNPKSTFARYHWQSNEKGYEQGFGRQVLGETWISHHGNHGSEATRGIIAPDAKDHPIARGLKDGDVFGPTDVYGVRLPLPGDSKPIVLGQVVAGMKPTDPPQDRRVTKKKVKDEVKEFVTTPNDPMMPVAWTRTYKAANGKPARVFTTTMGASQDLASEGTRRMLVNAVYWCVGMEEQIPPSGTTVPVVEPFSPRPFGFNTFRKGVRPSDLELK